MNISSSTIDSTLKTAGGCSLRIIVRIISYIILGLLINIPFLMILTPDFIALFHAEGIPDTGIGHKTGGRSDIVLIIIEMLVWIGKNLIPLGLFILFVIGFLLAYFLIGKKDGIASALNYTFNMNKAYIIGNILNKFVEFLNARVDLSKQDIHLSINDEFNNYIKRMKNQPVFIRWLSRAFLNKQDFLPTVSEFFENKNKIDLLSEIYIPVC